MGIEFEFLKAGNGDCILISTDNTSILIDGGTKKTYGRVLKKKLEALREKNKMLDLVILTHIDSDHIGGIIKLLENEKKLLDEKTITSSMIKRLWFNAFEKKIFSDDFSSETSYSEYKSFKEFISDMNAFIEYDDYITIDNQIEYTINTEIKLFLLSPNNKSLKKMNYRHREEIKEDFTTSYSEDYNSSLEDLVKLPFKKDRSIYNGASIAFILEYDSMKYLFLGDAHIDLIIESLINQGYSKDNPLEVDFVKLSHHGSKKNINQEFLNLLKSNNFIVLTNGASHGHPDKEALSRIILNPNRDFSQKINFICNYETVVEDNMFLYEYKNKYNVEMMYQSKIVMGESYA